MSKVARVAGFHHRGWKIWPFLPALMLVGCSVSDDPNAWYNKTVVENLSGRSDVPPTAPPGYGASIPAAPGPVNVPQSPPPPGVATASAATAAATAAPRVLPDNELYRSEASCGGMILGSGSPPSMAASQSVGLGMTECEVVRRLGAPDRMELTSAGEQRLLTLTYGRGEHPRLYRFAAGHLYAIEALPPPAASARRAR